MQKTLSLIRREFKTKVFTRMFIISTLLGPVVILSFYLLPMFFLESARNEALVIQYVDQSGLWGEGLGDLFAGEDGGPQPAHVFAPVEAASYFGKEDAFYKSINDGNVDALIVIPPDVLDGAEVIYYYKSRARLMFMRELQQKISQALNRIRLEQAGIAADQIAQLTAGVDIHPMLVDESSLTEDAFDARWTLAFVFLLMVYTTIIFYGTAVMRGVLEEKTSRIMEVLLSSARPLQLMLGKIFGIGSVGLFQYLLWIAGAFLGIQVVRGAALSGVSDLYLTPEVLFFFVLFFLLGYFQFSAILAGVGAICSSQEDAQALSAPIMFLVIVPFLISISLATSDVSGGTARLLSLLPFFAPMLMFLRIILGNPQLWEVLLSIVINVLAIIVLSYLAARIYRVGVLMYGKRPGFAEIARWIGRT